jgi:hypothetical protein
MPLDSASGELLGNCRQALSHIGLVNGAWAIRQAETGAAELPPCHRPEWIFSAIQYAGLHPGDTGREDRRRGEIGELGWSAVSAMAVHLAERLRRAQPQRGSSRLPVSQFLGGGPLTRPNP